jgi:TolA-binding protein
MILGAAGWWLLQPQTPTGGAPPVVAAPKPHPPAATKTPATPKPTPKPPARRPQEESDEARTVDALPPASPQRIPPLPPAQQPASPPVSPDYSALAAAYYREEDFIPGSAAATANEPPGYGQALERYRSGQYADAEKLLKPLVQLTPKSLKTKELLAHSLYKKGQYDAAITQFRDLSASADKAVAERSEWAMALTLLHRMPAKKTLLHRALDKIIARPGHAYYPKAKELKNKIGK